MRSTMPRRLLLFVLAAFLLGTGLWAQEPVPAQEPKPEAQPAPAKTPPDAFHYFFGKKDKDKRDAKDSKDETKKEPAAKGEKAKAEKEIPAKK